MIKHGDRPKGKKIRLYNIWSHMCERCKNPNFVHFDNYGGRGIGVYQEWAESYDSFRIWALSNGYRNDLTLDRIDNDSDYTPDNCRWATPKEQANNRRSNRLLLFNGETRNIEGWCKITGLPRHIVDGRLARGWSVEKTLTTPVLTKGGKVRES
jgi:hypothetical protein